MGTGRGSHTVGRGQKGQKTRRKIHPLFEGTKTKKSLIQRLPLLRGKGKLKSLRTRPIIIDVGRLEALPAGSKVNVEVLLKHELVGKEAVRSGVKILGSAKVTKKLVVSLPVSSQARRAIESAGGTVL
jgi:ribosomal protein L15